MASKRPKFYENPPRMVVGSGEGNLEVTVNVCTRDGAWMVKWYLGQQSRNVKKDCLKKWSPSFSPPSNQESPIKKEKKETTGKAKQALKDTRKPSSSVTPSFRSPLSWTAINHPKPRQPSDTTSLASISKPSSKRTRQPSVATSSASISESRSKRTKIDDRADDRESQSEQDYIKGLFGERWAALDSKVVKLISNEIRNWMNLTKSVPSHAIVKMKRYTNSFGLGSSVFNCKAWDRYLDKTKQWADDETLLAMGATPLGSKGKQNDSPTAPTTRSVVFTLMPGSAHSPMEDWLSTWSSRVYGERGN